MIRHEEAELGYFQEFLSELRKIKINSQGYGSMPDLEKFVDAHLRAFDSAIMRKSLYPYIRMAVTMLQNFDWVNEMLKKNEDIEVSFCSEFSTYKFKVSREQEAGIQDYISEIQIRVAGFNEIETSLCETLELEIMPNYYFDGEMVFLAQGVWIIPTTISCCYMFDFNYNPDKKEMGFKEPCKFNSIEDAMEDFIDQNRLGSVIIVNNVKDYPLAGSVLPIVQDAYLERLGTTLKMDD